MVVFMAFVAAVAIIVGLRSAYRQSPEYRAWQGERNHDLHERGIGARYSDTR